VAVHGIRQAQPQPRQQPVSGGVAEGVVVLLEAVEVEQHDRARFLGRGAGQLIGHVVHQAAPVAQPRERVGASLLVDAIDHPLILGEHERGPHEHEYERRGRERERHAVHPVEVVVGEQDQAREAARERHEHHAQALVRGPLGPGGGLPRRCAHEQGRHRPERLEQRVVVVGPLDRLHQVDPVGHGRQREAEADQDPAAPGAPPGQAEDRHHQPQQEEVSDRVGQVGEHLGAELPGARVHDRPVHGRAGQRRGGERAGQAVEQQAGAHHADAGTRQQEQRDAGRRVVHEPEPVDDARVGRVRVIRIGDGPHDVGRRPGRDPHAHDEPCGALLPERHRAPEAEAGTREQEPVVEVILECRGHGLAREPGPHLQREGRQQHSGDPPARTQGSALGARHLHSRLDRRCRPGD
jgi:hypothetical protein